MPGKNEIVAGIRLEGEKEFRQEITSVNKSIAASSSELKKQKLWVPLNTCLWPDGAHSSSWMALMVCLILQRHPEWNWRMRRTWLQTIFLLLECRHKRVPKWRICWRLHRQTVIPQHSSGRCIRTLRCYPSYRRTGYRDSHFTSGRNDKSGT